MPINTKHPDYLARESIIRTCRDVVDGGEDKIKRRGELYLPRLSEQDDAEYAAYVNRAMFFNASRRTVTGLTGMIMMKDPLIKPDNYNFGDFGFYDKKETERINRFIEMVLREIITVKSMGILLDLPLAEETEEAIERIEPYLSCYTTENVINWFTNDKGDYTRVILREEYEIESEDKFEHIFDIQFRELYLEDFWDKDTETTFTIYQQQIWREKKVDDKSQKEPQFYKWGPPIMPFINGKPLEKIPFYLIEDADAISSSNNPPIYDVVKVNLSHYRSSADLEHGRHLTALPTPWVAGFEIKRGEKLRIGSAVAWIADDPTAKAGMLEYTGAGLGALEKALEQKEKLMAVLGARLLEIDKKAAEAAESQKMRRSGETSILAAMAGKISEMLSEIFTEREKWRTNNENAEIKIELNTEFVSLSVSDTDLKAWVEAYLSRGISWSTLFHNLKKSGFYAPGISEEVEKAKIMADIIEEGGDVTEEEEEDLNEGEEEEENPNGEEEEGEENSDENK
jgi:hypothetical protein